MLQAEVAHLLCRRTYEDQTCRFARFAECRIFREKTVAGNNRLGATVLARLDDRVEAQVAVSRGSAADVECDVGHFYVHRIAVGIGIDGHALDAHLLERAGDTHGDLAAVGDQYRLKHGRCPCHVFSQASAAR